MESFYTIAPNSEVSGEYVEKRSRFIAQLMQVESEQAANSFIDKIRSRHHDARHNVPAWILADGRERCSDDGEPRGTAGMPALEVLRGSALSNVCCVITRYFGGTLLGPGGLMRAYTAATQAAIEAAQSENLLIEMTLVVPVTCIIPYASYDRVVHLAQECAGKLHDSIFAEDVQMSITFKAGDEVRFVDAMRELALGEDLCLVGEPRFAAY